MAFGLYKMLGFRFAPRFRDLEHQRFWRADLHPARLGAAFPEYGRIDKTMHLLAVVDPVDDTYRRLMNRQLTVQEVPPPPGPRDLPRRPGPDPAGFVPRLHPSAHGRPSWADVPPYAARRRFARRLSVHSGRQKAKARRLPTPCHSQRIAHQGACGKTRVVPQNRRPKPEPAEIDGGL